MTLESHGSQSQTRLSDSTTGAVLIKTYELLIVYTVMLGLGFVFLLTFNNSTIKNLGKGLYTCVSVISVVVFFDLALNLKKFGLQGVSLGFGAIALILGVTFYVLYLIFDGLLFVFSENNEVSTNYDPVVELKRWKELLDDNTITEEEFAMKKKEILNCFYDILHSIGTVPHHIVSFDIIVPAIITCLKLDDMLPRGKVCRILHQPAVCKDFISNIINARSSLADTLPVPERPEYYVAVIGSLP